MDQFSKDMLRFGTLQCFSCFTMYLRGREELLLTVRNQATSNESKMTGLYSSRAEIESLDCCLLPYLAETFVPGPEMCPRSPYLIPA